MTKIEKIIIPYNKFFNDSGKYLIDIDKFISINIPHNITQSDTDTGEYLNNFKQSSLEIPYHNNKIRVGTVMRNLNGMHYNKVCIGFSSKVAGADYFSGIKKEHFIDILNFLQQKGYLMFENANEIYKNTYVGDYDVKCDFLIPDNLISEFKKYNLTFKDIFNGKEGEFRRWDNKSRGYGIQTYRRENSSLSNPFTKFYAKSKELIEHSKDFFQTLPESLQFDVMSKFIWRYEFTLKNKKFFDEFGISNRLEDVNEISQEKWLEIGRSLLNANYQPRVKKPQDTSKLTPHEKKDCFCFSEYIAKGETVHQIRKKYVDTQSDKKARFRMGKYFDRIYYFSTVQNEHTEEIRNNYEMIEKWDKFFGLF